MTEAKKAVARKDISKEYQWQVEKLYTDEALWEADLNTARDLLGKAKDFQGHLADSVLIFLDFLSYQEDLSRLLDKAYLYAAMKKDEDNSVAHYQDMKDRVMGLVVEAESVLSFFQPEVLAMPQYRLGEYLQNPKIDIYRKFLLDITRQRPHTLSMEEERILSMTGEMAASFQTIYGMLCNVDMEFPMIINDAGQEEQLTHGNYIRLMESPQREVRKNAYNALYAAYGKENNTIASIYNSSVKKDAFYARVHKYDSALAASLFADNVPIAVYDKLIGCVRNHLPLLWEYLDLRKELLNLDQLAMYDVYVPLFNKGERQYNYQEAKETILKGLAPLGDEYLQKVAQGLDSGWVDVYENIGKTPGAYSTGIYGSDPYILMNFQGNLNSVFTLAHEMGHSMHTYYSNTKQPYIYAGYRIFVAEVASTVNETILIDYLLKNAQNKDEKLYILNNYLEEFRGTVFRQTMFAEFEKATHWEVESGRTLTAEKLNKMYYGLNSEYFGKIINADDNIALEWSRIPHFYRAFYVYKYATGFSAAQALAQGLLDPDPLKAKKAREGYIRFLSAGDSLEPIAALKEAGVDMTTTEPVEAAMKIFGQRLAEIKALL